LFQPEVHPDLERLRRGCSEDQNGQRLDIKEIGCIDMRNLRQGTALCIAIGLSLLMTACGGVSTPPPPTTYTLTVNSTNPASGVTIDYSNPLNNVIVPGTTSFTVTETAGTTLHLTAPATVGSNTFTSWSGCTSTSTVTCLVTLNANMTVTANYAVPATTYKLTVNSTDPASGVAIGVSPADINSATNGNTSFTRTYNAGTSVTLTAPATSGSNTFSSWTGCTTASSVTCNVTMSAATTVTANYFATATVSSSVTVNQSSLGPAVTDKILGMNLAAWYDEVGNATAVNDAFAQAGIQAIRWPGGSWSDEYHWQTPNSSSNPNLPFMCENNSSGVPNGSTGWGGYSTFGEFVTSIVQGGNYDLALTADYGTNVACTGPGDPSEAAAWVAEAKTLGITVSHMTVGNEEYGSWETDLHSTPHDPTIYAAAVAGTNGYYALIKKANSSTLVGVEVEPNYAPWDQDVMSNAPYDFVEYHYYPETPGSESDSFLVNQAAQNLTANINTIRAELVKWGTPNTPIFVGEIGGPYSNPGKQSWSISQGLYAGQVLGEMMNDGVSRLTWWIGFGNCNGDNGNDSSSLYGWQNFGAYNVFADGAGDTGGTNNSPCNYGGPTGTMSPTARAFQLFSNVAVTGESVLTASVTGDTADVVAYAATHSGGTALVLFNRNETTAEPVVVTFSGQSNSSGVTVITYDKAIYDQSSSTTPVWAAPTTTNLGAQSLPLSLTLTPWSMNVVLIK